MNNNYNLVSEKVKPGRKKIGEGEVNARESALLKKCGQGEKITWVWLP
jgi:hypothetical protein